MFSQIFGFIFLYFLHAHILSDTWNLNRTLQVSRLKKCLEITGLTVAAAT